MERVSPEKPPKVYIKGSQDTELYFPNPDTNDCCSLEYKQIEVKKSTIIHRKCERDYVPLEERTKTLTDLKKDDSTENREKAEYYINRYEARRKRIMNERK